MKVRAYGDTMDDGAVQLSFTLPMAHSPKAREAARLLAQKMGLRAFEVVHAASLADDFTFFVVYGKTTAAVDVDQIQVHVQEEGMDYHAVNEFIREHIGRRIVVVGACTGFDAHTVGIDAIMNMKGYDHHYGLERYPMIDVHNLGAQVSNELLIQKAVDLDADAVLVSQVVTQKDTHIYNLTHFIELLEAEGLRSRFVLCVGGPRITHELALELGFDAGFGRGTYPEHVASFIVKKMVEREMVSSS
jgi:beta-lysine 5,6-aminomutase beta subunit